MSSDTAADGRCRPGDDGAVPTVGDLADRAIEALRDEQPEGPYRVGGYSFGALVAFEVATRPIEEYAALAGGDR